MALVEEAMEATAEVVDALGRLLPQLSSSCPPPTAGEVAEIISASSTVLLIAREEENGPIIGSLTLVLFRIPTGVRAWVEDVVVDVDARGRGIGDDLGREALRRASAAGARSVDLTSRPSREAANRLYQRLGFTKRETNVWRFDSRV